LDLLTKDLEPLKFFQEALILATTE